MMDVQQRAKDFNYDAEIGDLRDKVRKLEFQLTASRKREAELVEFMEGIVSASPGKWEMSRDEFEAEFVIWARNVAKGKLTALRSAGQETGGE